MYLMSYQGCGIDKQNFACLQDKVRTTQPSTTKLGSYIPSHIYYLIRFWRNSVGNVFCQIFFENFRCLFFKVKHSIGHILGMVCPIDVDRK